MTWRATRHPDDEPPRPAPLGVTMAGYLGQQEEEPPEPDPFAVPLEEADDPFAVPLEPEPTPPQRWPLVLSPAALIASPPRDLGAFTVELRSALMGKVTALAEDLHSRRPGGRLTEASLAVEVEGLDAARQALLAVAGAFTDAADLARDCLAELTLEVKGDEVERRGGSTSIRVGTAGGDLRVTVTQPTKVSVVEDGVLGVVAAVEADARSALARLRTLIGSPTWKITALDAYRRELERLGRADLAADLAAAYGKTPHGRARTEVKRVEE